MVTGLEDVFGTDTRRDHSLFPKCSLLPTDAFTLRAEHLTLHQHTFPFIYSTSPSLTLSSSRISTAGSGRMQITSCLPQISWRHPTQPVPTPAKLLAVVVVLATLSPTA
ncbi:uncharacterized protein M8220_006237 isoform 1-T1 [Acridotheres tristis]